MIPSAREIPGRFDFVDEPHPSPDFWVFQNAAAKNNDDIEER